MMDSLSQSYGRRHQPIQETQVVPPSNLILSELDLTEAVLNFGSFSRGLKPFQRAEYRAVINWLTKYQTEPGESKQEQIQHLLEVFHHLCKAEDFERSFVVFSMRINSPINEELHIQLRNWGQYSKLKNLCEEFLRLLNSKAIEQVEAAKIANLKIICLNDLGVSEFAIGNCISSQGYYTQQKELSRTFRNLWGEASALIGLGNNFELLGKHQEATGQYLSAFEIASEIFNQKLKMAAISGLGNIQINLGHYELAIEHFQKQLRIAEEIFDDLGKVEALAALGNSYSLLKEYELAIDHHLRALKIAHALENLENEARVLKYIGFTFSSQEENHAAIAFYKKSLTISQEIKLFLEEAEVLLSIGILERKRARSRQDIEQFALEKLMQSLTRFITVGSPLGRAKALKELAETYENLGEMALALKYCNQALELATEAKMPLKLECEQLIRKYSETAEPIKRASHIRRFREIDKSECSCLKNEIEVVIFTAVDVELNAVLEQLKPYPRKKEVFKLFEGPETYYIGKFGAFKTVVTKCRMGSVSEGSIILATEQAQRIWLPKVIIMVGIAFGKDSTKQNIGDVIVASQVISYEQQRVGQSIMALLG